MRQLATRAWRDGADIWVDLVSPSSGSVVAPKYGRGASEEEALASAMKRYRLEQADWDQSDIQIAIEFVPTITTSPAVRQLVNTAFAREGIDVVNFERSSFQLEAELEHPDWKWASPSLTVHLTSNLSVDDIIRRVAPPVALALTSVRQRVPDLPFGILIGGLDGTIRLAFKHDDGPQEVEKSVGRLPTDLAARKSIGWDRERSTWFDL